MCLSFGAAALIVVLKTGAIQRPSFSLAPDWSMSNWLDLTLPIGSSTRSDGAEGFPTVSVDGPDIVVSLSERQIYVYQGDRLQISYPAAIGQGTWETPTGEFQVTQMQENPVWQHPITGELFQPGPKNPLGERWIGFWSDGYNQIGFHGTNQESLIGQAVSHGCVRMYNQDIQDLFERIQLGTSVTVLP